MGTLDSGRIMTENIATHPIITKEERIIVLRFRKKCTQHTFYNLKCYRKTNLQYALMWIFFEFKSISHALKRNTLYESGVSVFRTVFFR